MAKFDARYCTGNWTRIALAVVFGWSSTLGPSLADIAASKEQDGYVRLAQAPSATQAATSPPVSGPVYSLTDLEFMLAPIALYPDPLLTLMMTASAHFRSRSFKQTAGSPPTPMP